VTLHRFRVVVRALACLREFGLLRGAHIFYQLYGTSRVLIQMPGYRAPLWLRSWREDPSDISVFEKVFLQREYDHPLGNLDPKVIVDGGAFIGCTAAFFAHKYPAAKIIAIEPDQSNFERLVSNASRYENVTPLKAALWNKNAWVQMTNYRDGHLALRIREVAPDTAGAVPARTIPDVMAELGLEHIDILKLDIEWAEEQLFDPSCQVWLDKVSAIMIELHDWIRPGPSLAFYRAISQQPFEQHLSGENVIVLK
jgi:FkbM family methyltransferase